MYIDSGDLTRYHEERVNELTRVYQDSKRQDALVVNQIRAMSDRIRSWFDGEVDTVSGAGSRLETQTVRVENR
jgi:fructose-1,6-bisphosphatase/sedoheptulose 1,7-bisphosphatase-like protein